MSKLEELIEQYCPDGVKYVKLGDFATQWYRGAGIKKDEIAQEGIPCIRYGEIHTIYKIWFDKCISHTDEAKQPSKKYADYGDILFAITSEDIPFIGNSVAYMGKDRIMVGGDIVVMKHTQNPKYISYALSTIDAVSQKGKGKVKSKVVHTNVPSLKEIVIPVPPLPVQEEIVRILDTFTELQAELQAELQKRKQQYNYYLDNLLSFNDINRGGQAEVRWMKLKDIGKVCMCKRILKSQTSSSGDVPFFKIGTFGDNADAYISQALFNEYKAKYSYPQKGDVLISAAGTIGKTIVFDGTPSYFQDSNIVWLKHDESIVLNSYLRYCYTLNPWVVSTGGTIARLYNDNILEATIPVPSLAEQQRIVSILDRFDRLTNDLTSGLPAEIEKRKQQYEYYRDKLLTFKRKGA